MPNYRQYETCQRKALLALLDQMNTLHATMGGRDRRPERLALSRCMRVLQKELDRSAAAFAHSTN